MLTRESIHARRDEINAIARRYGATDIRIFGSVARNEATGESDVDFLVRFEPGRTLLDQGGLLMDLRELLGVDVDVISEGALSGRFEKEAIRDLAAI
jgi:uncharacterized protein